MHIRPALLLSLFLITHLWSEAQIDTIGMSVIGKDDAVVAKPTKKFTSPVIEEPESKLPTFTYDIPKFMYRVEPFYSPAKAIGIRPGSGEDLYGNYIQLGFGNYLTSFADIHLHNLVDDDYDYGGYVRHFSSVNGKPKFADFSENGIGIYGKKFGRRGVLSGRLDFRRDVIHYYGFDRDADSLEELRKRDINQIYNRFEGNAGYSLRARRGFEKMDLGFDFYTLSNIGNRENDFKINNNTWFKAGPGVAGIDAELEFLNFNSDTSTFNRTYITFHPFYSFKFRKFELNLGADVVVYGDSSGFKPYVFPNVVAGHFIVPDKLRFYAGIGGGIVRNRLNDLVEINPFVVSNPVLQNSIMKLNIYAGLKGIVLKKLDFVLEVKNRLYSDYGLFVTDPGYRRNFQVVYDDLNVLSLRSDVSFNLDEKLFIGLGNVLYNYSNLKTEQQPWQLPTFRLHGNVEYTFAKKLNVRLQAYVIGERSQRDPLKETDNVENLPAITDINLLTQYKYKENITFFINIHNITNSRYQQWYNYDVYGLNVLGGVKFSL